MSTWLPLAFVIAFGSFALVLPLLRLVRTHRRWGIVRSTDPVRAVMVTSLLSAVVASLAWAVALPLLGPEALGVWSVPETVGIAGAFLGLTSLLLIVVAQAQMGASWRIGIADEPTGLVTWGLFGTIRHPIYTGLFGLLAALVLASPAAWTVMGAGWLVSLIAVQAHLEERHLAEVHGQEFARWAAHTGRFLPGLGRISSVPFAEKQTNR